MAKATQVTVVTRTKKKKATSDNNIPVKGIKKKKKTSPKSR